jgi:SAM-dependent methyltransferase
MVYDLGCGDGRLVIEAAKRARCRGVGFDKDPQRVAEARANIQQKQVEDLVRIEECDIFSVDLSKANVVVMYLLPWMVKALVPQFDAMTPGSRIVSHDFRIEGIEPDKIVEVEAGKFDTRQLILYVTPLRRSPPPKTARSPKS